MQSLTKTQLRTKIFKVLLCLITSRVALYIPVPGVDLDITSSSQSLNPFFSFANVLSGNSFLGVGSLGIIPFINASILMQLLTRIFPTLEEQQKEGGELGRRRITQYTRYLTLGCSLVLSTGFTLILLRPILFDWSSILGFKIILSLTAGAIICMWLSELISEERIGNGPSMLIFLNILSNIPANLTRSMATFDSFSLLSEMFNNNLRNIFLYIVIVLVIILFQAAYKKIGLISASQLNVSTEFQDSTVQLSERFGFIPLKLNQSGIMPLVFSSTCTVVLISLFQSLISFVNITIPTQLITFSSFLLNIILIVFFSCFYASIVLKPKELATTLSKMAYSVIGIKQGNATAKYLEKASTRLAVVSGIFLAFLSYFPILATNFFQLAVFRDLTSLVILVGVIVDTTAQIQGYLISSRYESKKTVDFFT